MASGQVTKDAARHLAATLRPDLLKIFDETFRETHGIYLDGGTSLFDTLGGVSAEEASRPVSATCASIAAQVEHVRFYLEVAEGSLLRNPVKNVDWDEIWRTVHEVTSDDWDESRERLRRTQERLVVLFKRSDLWDNSHAVGPALAALVHSAYHLGEVRQALCVIKGS